MTHNGVLLELHDTTVLQFPFDLRHNLPSMGAPIGTAAVRLGADPGYSNYDTCYDPFLGGAFDPSFGSDCFRRDPRFGSDCFRRDIFSQPSESALITLDVAGSPNPKTYLFLKRSSLCGTGVSAMPICLGSNGLCVPGNTKTQE